MAKAAPKLSASYEAKDIVWFEGLRAVREKPGMYLGGKDSDAITHASYEVVDNCIDEAMNGHGSHIQIHLSKDGYITVKDEGRGIPVGPHPEHKTRNTLTLVVSELHAGGKMGAGSYAASGGVHGVGVSVVNAVSESFQVWSYRNKQWNTQSFKAGKEVTKVLIGPAPKIAGLEIKPVGTIIRFKPDPVVFDKGAHFLPKKLLERIENVAEILPVKFTFIDEVKGKTKIIHKPKGLQGLFDKVLKDNEIEQMGEPFIYSDGTLDVMIGWASTSASFISSYVSYIRTVDGGTHVEGLKDAVYNTFNEFCGSKDIYTKDALTKGMIALVNVKMHGPTFTSQDKVKLATKEVRADVNSRLYWNEATQTYGALYDFLKKNKALVAAKIDRANEYARLHEQFQANTALAAKMKTESKGKLLLPEKLMTSTTKIAAERELFLIEGDSAGGTVIKSRNTLYQEVFPMKGKIPNIWKLGPDRVFANQVIIDLLQSIGYNPKAPGEYRVGKIMLLTDADDDGSHIAALVLGFLWYVVPDIFKQDMVYLVDAPLYTYHSGGTDYVLADSLQDLMKKNIPKFNQDKVTRLKGWGETNEDVMELAAFKPETRALSRPLHIETEEELQHVIDMLGEDTAGRKELLGL